MWINLGIWQNQLPWNKDNGMFYKKLICFVALILVISLISLVLIRYQLINPLSIKMAIAKFGVFAPIIFILIFVIATIMFVPAMPISLAGGFIFGLSQGLVYNLIGTTIGASCAFLLARHYGQDWIRKKAGPRLQLIMNGAHDDGWRYVALLRLMPFTPFTLLNYVFGITPIRLTHFVMASFIFSFPGCYAFAYIGHLGGRILSNDVVHIKEMLLGLGILATLLLIIQMIKNFYLNK
jgi:uncharacterized membrane protein YdjX (TVP38/TMEM64 family)